MLQQGGPTMGPFRATRLWNDLIQVFRSGMPLKKHRWRVRLYDNCFTASDAVDWLHDHLRANINFGPEVTRQQTIQLLRKFVKSNIIHEVRRKEYKETVFEDDGHLFRFTRTSPTKVLQPSSVLSSRTNLQQSPSKSQPPLTITNLQQSPMKVGKRLPECKLVMKTITQYDIEDAWKTMTLASLQKILGLSTLEELISSEKIIAKHVIHNANNVNKNGIVTLLNKEEDLPYWVLSAMRCLANWPNRLDDGLPSYPGFERDVFKSVTDYFQSLPEPLLTYEYYDLFTNVLVMAERRDRGFPAVDISCIDTSDPNIARITPVSKGLTSFQSVENLMLNLTLAGKGCTPMPVSKNSDKNNEELIEQSFSITRRVNEYQKQWYASEENLAPVRVPRPPVLRNRNVIYETSLWTASNKPRIYVDERQQRKYTRHQNYLVHANALRNPLAPTPPPSSPTKQSTVSLKNSQKFSSAIDISSVDNNNGSGLSKSKKFSSLTDVSEKVKDGKSLTRSRFGSASQLIHKIFKRQKSSKDIPNEIEQEANEVFRPVQESSSTPKNIRQPVQSLHTGCSSIPSSVESSRSSLSSRVSDMSSYYTPRSSYPAPLRATASLASLSIASSMSNDSRYCTPPTSTRSTDNQFRSISGSNLHGYNAVASGTALAEATMKRSYSTASLYATDSSCAQDALQLCCMMLPPSNRKKLHLLLRMMSKMENNEELNLVDGISTRQLVLQTFSRCILSCMQEVGLDEILAMRLVTYMMDNYIEILKVPEQLRNDVEQRIAYLRRGKIKYSDEENAYAYCEQVSKEEYEKQKLSNSQDAIAELLEGIIKDRQMPVKEKRKKLRQFQRAYPNIYAKRLPTTASEAELFPEKPTIKQPMLSMVKPFSRRRNNMRY